MAPYAGPTRKAAMSLSAEKVGEANGDRLPVDYSESMPRRSPALPWSGSCTVRGAAAQP